MTSNKVLITIILIFFKSYNACEFLDFKSYLKCSNDLETIGFDNTNTFINIVLLRSFAVNRDPPIKICSDSVNKDGCDEKLYTDTASPLDALEPLLNQNLNEKITNESINKESKSEICNHSVNKLRHKKKKENTAPLPGDLPDDRQLFLNHALQELNNLKKNNYENTGSLPAYINEYCDDLIKIKYNVPFRTPLQYCEYLYEQLLTPRAKCCNIEMQSNGENEKDFFIKIVNYFKAPFNVNVCKSNIIEKYYDEFNAYKNFIITMKINDPNVEEYTLENLNEMAKIYFNHEKSIIDHERNRNNDYYTTGAGKWCDKKFKKKKLQINTSDTSGASSTSDTSAPATNDVLV